MQQRPAQSARLATSARLAATLVLLAGVGGPIARAAEPTLAEANTLLLTGKYAEAEEAFEKLSDSSPAAALGEARAQLATGERDDARATLTAAVQKHPQAAALPAELAILAFDRGDYAAAQQQVDAALRLDPDQPAAHWINGELHRTAGRLPEADREFKWFVDFYNAKQPIKDPELIVWIGRGSAQFVRWHRLSEQFSFLVNELLPDATALDRNYWAAHLETGLLYLEKYNQAEADKEFKAALAINPNAAEVYAAVAELALQNYDLAEAKIAIDRALEINPQLLRAQQLRAESNLANFEADEAIKILEAARELNPLDEKTLGTLAAAYATVDGLRDEPAGTRMGKILDEVNARNPHAGEFYFALASALDQVRRFPAAARYYQEAATRMPQLNAARGQLGLMYMRLGQEVEAEKLLKESFDIDPFNVRVSNTLKVLDVLSNYAVLETDHFVIKFDRGQDDLLARYAARYLEEDVYPSLVKKLGYAPPGKSLLEIFSHAKNTDGHGWFSARMVGLPYIGTVGACAGKMVAMTSPTDARQKFNWARVLKHEFVHVVNLQQTNFNIPHWYTEALAVYNEGYPRPREWNDVLAERFAKDTLFNLDTINLGFIRPKSSQDWTLAYCQAELYAEYLLKRFGDDSLAKMLQAYADNLNTRDALQKNFGVAQEDFEHGYRDFLKQVVAGTNPTQRPVEMSFAELIKAHDDAPDNPDIAARLAHEYLKRRTYPKARELAEGALKTQPRHQLATYVLARLRFLVGDDKEGIAMLEACLDRDAPQENVLALLAGIKSKAEDYAAAAQLYELGARHDPTNLEWTKALARMYLEMKDDVRLAGALETLAAADTDDAAVRKKLAEISLAAKDYPAAARWAQQAVQVDVMDAEVHRIWAEALVGQQKLPAAVEEFEALVRLKPDEPSAKFSLAQAYAQANQPDKAKAALDSLLKANPQYPGAVELLKAITK